MLTELQKQKLPALFSAHDASQDGFLTQADHEQTALHYIHFKGLAPDSPAGQQIMNQFLMFWQGLAQAADVNKDGQVGLEEWFAYWDNILSSPEIYNNMITPIAHSALNMMDKDGDGQINAEEYTAIYRCRGLAAELGHQNFAQLDLNGDGYISLEESLTLLEQYFRSNNPQDPGNWFFGPW